MTDEKKIEDAEPDELLKHGGDKFDEAGNHFTVVQPHLDGAPMDASWRLRADRCDPQVLTEGTPESEGLARVALKERREDSAFKEANRKVRGILDGLTGQEEMEVLMYGDTVEELEKQGALNAEFADSDVAKEARKRALLAKQHRKFEADTEQQMINEQAGALAEEYEEIRQEQADLKRKEMALLEKLKKKYE